MAKSRRYNPRNKTTKVCLGTSYFDVVGNEWNRSWLAKLSSFFYIIRGCFKYGFPIHTNKIVHRAWTFYPFIVFSTRIPQEEVASVIVHERIHACQQRNILTVLGIPLIALTLFLEFSGGNFLPWLLLVPFLPTIMYGLAMLVVFVSHLIRGRVLGFEDTRKLTCFELEATLNQETPEYLAKRRASDIFKYLYGCTPNNN